MNVDRMAPQQPHRKSRRGLWITLTILIVILVLLPLFALGWTGLYQVPVVSALFGTNKPIDLGVHPTTADLTSALADNPMTFVGEPSTWYGMAKRTYSGTVPIDDVHSSAEVTAFIEEFTGGRKYARDIQVKFNDGGMEISAFVTPRINAPVYADVGVVRTSPISVSITVRSAKLGRLTIPSGYYDDIATEATKWINERLAEVSGLSIEELEYTENIAHLKGILPATVEQVPGEEYTIFGKKLSEY